jgi:hypothetical protein
MEKQKEYNLRYLLAKVHTTRGKASVRLRQRTKKNITKTVSGVFRHRSGTGKSYCRTRFDVGSGRPAQPRTQHGCHHGTNVKPEAATAVIELLMMGGKTPETF